MASGVDGTTGLPGPSGGGGSVSDVENELNPIGVGEGDQEILAQFEYAIFNSAMTAFGAAQNDMQKAMQKPQEEEKKRKMVMGMLKQGMT
jgi:hypothetical protein